MSIFSQKKIKSLYEYAKRHWLTLSFIFGFISDNLILHRIDQARTNIILFSYTTLTMFATYFLYAGISGRYRDKINKFFKRYAPVVIQFTFGGVLSGMLIFYSRSGSIMNSWPFLLIIILVIYGNETIKDRGSRLVYNLSIFFVGLFAYCALITPVILGKMGDLVFLGSGILALCIMYLFFLTLTRIIPNFIALQKRSIVFSIGLIYVFFNFFYFTNIIPPIPLALKELGVYHSIVHFLDNDTYQLTYEKPLWWELFRNSDTTFHYEPNDALFCFTSVFAPTRLATDIYHRWEYYDETKGTWVDYGRFSYPISGGRGEGYRGYTELANFGEGKWRCTVETERGQILGSETVVVVKGGRGELVTRVE